MLMDIGGDVIISTYYKSFIGMPKQKYLIINLRPDIMSRVWGLEIPDQKLSGIFRDYFPEFPGVYPKNVLQIVIY